MDDFQTLKKRARTEAAARRNDAAHDGAAENAARIFLDTIQLDQRDTVSLYRAIRSELDPAPLTRALWDRGIETCLPVVTAADTPLTFKGFDADTRFSRGAFGTENPEGTPEVTPTLVIAPLLAFDRRLYRLGYGGGFYDRTLENLRAANSKTRAYGYAYAAQEVAEVPIEPTDQRLDGIVTEAGLITL